MKIERRGFIGTLLALPVFKLAVPAPARAEPTMVPVFEFAPKVHVFDAALGDMLGLETRVVSQARFEFRMPDGRVDHNYCEIFRTPVGWAGRKEPSAEQLQELRWFALEEHLRTIRTALDHGRRHCFFGSRHLQTYTGGRQLFGGGQGMLAVYRGRGLAFKQIGENYGEWFSDVGFLPGELIA